MSAHQIPVTKDCFLAAAAGVLSGANIFSNLFARDSKIHRKNQRCHWFTTESVYFNYILEEVCLVTARTCCGHVAVRGEGKNQWPSLTER